MRYNKELETREEIQRRQRRSPGPPPTAAEHAHVPREAPFAEARHMPLMGPPPVPAHAANISPYQTASTARQPSAAPPLPTQKALTSSNPWLVGTRRPLPQVSTVEQLEALDDDQFMRLLDPLHPMHLYRSAHHANLVSRSQPLHPDSRADIAGGALKRKRSGESMDTAAILTQRPRFGGVVYHKILPAQPARPA